MRADWMKLQMAVGKKWCLGWRLTRFLSRLGLLGNSSEAICCRLISSKIWTKAVSRSLFPQLTDRVFLYESNSVAIATSDKQEGFSRTSKHLTGINARSLAGDIWEPHPLWNRLVIFSLGLTSPQFYLNSSSCRYTAWPRMSTLAPLPAVEVTEARTCHGFASAPDFKGTRWTGSKLGLG